MSATLTEQLRGLFERRNKMDIVKTLELHRKWLNGENGGECADLRDADLRGADLDFSCWPLWCGSLGVHIDDKLAIQLLYHLIFNVDYSKNISQEIKNVLLTDEIIELANKFHRVDETGKIKTARPAVTGTGKTKF